MNATSRTMEGSFQWNGADRKCRDGGTVPPLEAPLAQELRLPPLTQS